MSSWGPEITKSRTLPRILQCRVYKANRMYSLRLWEDPLSKWISATWLILFLPPDCFWLAQPNVTKIVEMTLYFTRFLLTVTFRTIRLWTYEVVLGAINVRNINKVLCSLQPCWLMRAAATAAMSGSHVFSGIWLEKYDASFKRGYEIRHNI